MPNVNKVIVVGHLGDDPDMRYLPSGSAVVNLSLATTDKWKDKETGEQKERTEWHRVSFFAKQAELIGEYCRKGDPLYVEGSLQTRKWQDKDGNDRWTTEIKGREFQFLKGRNDGGTSAPRTEPAKQDAEPKNDDAFDDDIPF